MSTPNFTIENLRQIYCMDYETFNELFNFTNLDYGKYKYHKMQNDLGRFLCELDNRNVKLLYNYLNGAK